MIARKRYTRVREVAPDEIFLDSSNLPARNDPQFEARLIAPLSSSIAMRVYLVFVGVAVVFAGRAFFLQIVEGSTYAKISRDNRLERSVLFATRGNLYDRTLRPLAWSEAGLISQDAEGVKPVASTSPFAFRRYDTRPGLSLLVGYVYYPKVDARGLWWRESYSGVSGLEAGLNDVLEGKNGSILREINAHGTIVRQNIIEPPTNGSDVTLSIDAEVQSELHRLLSAHARDKGFTGGASVIMDVHSGEILALTSFPEYNNTAFAAGDAAVVRATTADPRTPLLNRATVGLYTPGSIVKPFFAAAALNERIISPDTQIVSTGAIVIPNPYDKDRPSVFRDWTVHGPVDMRTAIAVSSDEYFYVIGGGYGSQRGLGIRKLDEYAQRFGFGEITGIAVLPESEGVIPTPEWKIATFGENDSWRIGNTYHTAIGQYGFQVTPLQAVRATAAIANGGRLLTPQLVASSTPRYSLVEIPDSYLHVVRDGMRLAVISDRQDATVKSLNIPGISIAAKTGTAQIGTRNQWINSWSIGFWPAEHPRFAYATVLEKAPAATLSGAAPAMRPFFEWLVANHPEYIE